MLSIPDLKINRIVTKVIVDTTYFHHENKILKLLTKGMGCLAQSRSDFIDSVKEMETLEELSGIYRQILFVVLKCMRVH